MPSGLAEPSRVGTVTPTSALCLRDQLLDNVAQLSRLPPGAPVDARATSPSRRDRNPASRYEEHPTGDASRLRTGEPGHERCDVLGRALVPSTSLGRCTRPREGL